MHTLIVQAVRVLGPDIPEARLRVLADQLDAALLAGIASVAAANPDLHLSVGDHEEVPAL